MTDIPELYRKRNAAIAIRDYEMYDMEEFGAMMQIQMTQMPEERADEEMPGVPIATLDHAAAYH